MDNHLNALSADTDDEYDWEEVEVPEVQPRTIEITLHAQPKVGAEKKFVQSFTSMALTTDKVSERREYHTRNVS